MARRYHLRGTQPNLGDEPHPWLWPRLLPELFLDTTTIMNGGLPEPLHEIILSTACGYEVLRIS